MGDVFRVTGLVSYPALGSIHHFSLIKLTGHNVGVKTSSSNMRNYRHATRKEVVVATSHKGNREPEQHPIEQITAPLIERLIQLLCDRGVVTEEEAAELMSMQPPEKSDFNDYLLSSIGKATYTLWKNEHE